MGSEMCIRDSGKYRWSVLDHKMKMKTYDGRGNVTSATVSVSLQEYLRG